ncbi:hypothetical protein INR49_005690 [Caranx melampygus]|nr:hypothetical protein INR49_005690 [Caranx melampygus]
MIGGMVEGGNTVEEAGQLFLCWVSWATLQGYKGCDPQHQVSNVIGVGEISWCHHLTDPNWKVRQRDQLVEQLDEEDVVLFAEPPAIQLQKPAESDPGHSSLRRTALDRLALISANSSVASRSKRSE